MRIRLRFLLVANLLLVGLGIIGFVAIRDVDQASNTFSEAAYESFEQVKFSDQIRANLPDLRALELEYILTTNPHTQAALLARMETTQEALKQVMAHYKVELGGEQDGACGSCHQTFATYSQSHRQIEDLVGQGNMEEALGVYRDSTGQYVTLLDEADSFRQSQYSAARQASLRGQAMGERARDILIGCFVAAAVLIFAIGHTLSGYIHRRLEALMEGTRRVIRGDFSQPIKVEGRDEFGELSGAFNTMTSSLQRSEGENVHLHEMAIKMREERIVILSDGLRRVIEAQENERRRVARELHDEVGQALTALQLGLSRLETHTKSPKVRDAAASLRDMTVDTMRSIRELALDLRPSMLDEIGLVPTLHSYVKTFSRRVDVPIDLTVTGLAGRLPLGLEVTVFRIVQEALTNIARHAQASRAEVKLTLEDGIFSVTVQDDGVGFDVETIRADSHRSLGLSGMEERCRFFDGTFRIESGDGRGTRLVCTWRLPSEALASQGETIAPLTGTGGAAISSGSGGIS